MRTARRRGGAAPAGESARKIEGGGVFAPGWTGKVDASEAKQGNTLQNAKLAKEGLDEANAKKKAKKVADRIVHNAHRIQLRGESLRRKKAQENVMA